MRLLLVDSRVDTVAPVIAPPVDLSGAEQVDLSGVPVDLSGAEQVDLSGVQTTTSLFSSAVKEGVEVIVYSYVDDTYESILAKATLGSYESVGIVSHAYTKTFQLLQNESVATVENIQSVDPSLTSFDAFGTFLKSLGSPTIDLMACSLYSNEDWKYIFNGLETKYEIQIRASTDDTGNLFAGGNWVMESDNVNVKDLYFTELIEAYGGLLAEPNTDPFLSDLVAYSSEFEGIVFASTKDSSGNIYIGGAFVYGPDGRRFGYIAKYTPSTSTWSTLGSGLNGVCNALTVDSAGNLIAGGDFTTAGGITVNRIARWNGTTWSAFGTGFDASCRALAVHSNGDIFAGGDFLTANGVTVNRIARWNGSTWVALGTGLSGICRALGIHTDGSVYVGGDFATANGVTVNCITRWNGTTFVAFAGGLYNGACHTLAIASNGILYIGGTFTNVNGLSRLYLARWSGTAWMNSTSDLSSTCRTLAIDTNGIVYAGGDFLGKVSQWNGTTWTNMAREMIGVCYTITMDQATTFYAGGDFTGVGGRFAKNVARYDTMWYSIGSLPFNMATDEPILGTSTSRNNGNGITVNAMARYGNIIYVTGSFRTIGNLIVNGIAKWDGSTWSALGTGFGGVLPNGYALAVDANGILYAGGDFSSAGGVTATRIARWNGSSWSALGSGLVGGTRICHALAVEANGNVIAGGEFATAGGVSAPNIARWNGSAWSALGGGPGNNVRAIAIASNGIIYTGGTSGNVRSWNGTAWSPLGGG